LARSEVTAAVAESALLAHGRRLMVDGQDVAGDLVRDVVGCSPFLCTPVWPPTGAESGVESGRLCSLGARPAGGCRCWRAECGVMSGRVSLGAAGQRLGVSGGDIRRAGYTKVTAGRLGAWEHQPPAWLRKARARKRGPGMIVVRSLNVAGYFDGYVHRIATAEERVSVHRAAVLARAAFLGAPGKPES